MSVSTEHPLAPLHARLNWLWPVEHSMQLIKTGARATFGMSVLQYAISRGCIVKDVRAILSFGADVNERDCFGFTALCAATNIGSLEIVRVLCEAGADIYVVWVEGYGVRDSGFLSITWWLATSPHAYKEGAVDILEYLLVERDTPMFHNEMGISGGDVIVLLSKIERRVNACRTVCITMLLWLKRHQRLRVAKEVALHIVHLVWKTKRQPIWD